MKTQDSAPVLKGIASGGLLFCLVICHVLLPALSSPIEQGSSNVQFPTQVKARKTIFPSADRDIASGNNGLIPILGVNTNNENSNNNANLNSGGGQSAPVLSSEFQVGTTGIPCDHPGTFVTAPDGCNRCFCAENRQLSAACSRVFCPPGFPSSSQTQHRL